MPDKTGDMGNERLEDYFRRHYLLIFRVAFTQVKNHADAEDVLQEVFVRLLKYRPEFENEEHERAWLVRTTMNLCRDLMKSKWRRTTVGMEKIPEAERAYFKVPYLEQDDTLWAVLELPVKYRECLYFFYYEDYSVREIARILEIPENTVKTNLRRGREALKTTLKKEDIK